MFSLRELSAQYKCTPSAIISKAIKGEIKLYYLPDAGMRFHFGRHFPEGCPSRELLRPPQHPVPLSPKMLTDLFKHEKTKRTEFDAMGKYDYVEIEFPVVIRLTDIVALEDLCVNAPTTIDSKKFDTMVTKMKDLMRGEKIKPVFPTKNEKDDTYYRDFHAEFSAPLRLFRNVYATASNNHPNAKAWAKSGRVRRAISKQPIETGCS